MRNILSKVLLGTIMFLGACFASGCSSHKVELAAIVGNSSNSPAISGHSEMIEKTVYEASYTCGKVTFISAESKPRAYMEINIPEYEVSGLSENHKEERANAYKKEILDRFVENSYAQSEEVDLLACIEKASKSFSDEDSDKVLVIFHSGLSTAGYINMAKDDLLLSDDIDGFVEYLNDNKAISKCLEGVSVIWVNINEVAGDQPKLSAKQESRNIELWEKVLYEAGAKSVTFKYDVSTSSYTKGLPYVSIVKPEIVNSPDIEVSEIEIPDEPSDTGVWTLDSESVNFKGDLAVFVNEEEARAAIKEVADEILSNSPDKHYYVAGTTATGSSDFCLQLSEDRAKAVYDILVEFGVPAEMLEPTGLSFKSGFYTPDIDENGYMIEAIAKTNRAVYIVDFDSEDAAKVSLGD